MIGNVAKSFDILATSILHHFFESPTKLFLDLCLVKFLDTLIKKFFFYNNDISKEDNFKIIGEDA